MARPSPAAANPPAGDRRPNRFAAGLTTVPRAVRHQHWAFKVGLVLFGVIVAVLILTPWIAPYDPDATDLANRLAHPSSAHWLGTDQLGRDELSRVMYGGRFSVTIAAITLVLSAVIGIVLGAVVARRRGILDEFVMRLVDLLIAFPEVVVALFLVAMFGTSYLVLIAALTVVGWTPFARMMRGQALEIYTKEYIEAAEAQGCSRSFVLFRHVLPNALGPIFAISWLRFGHKLIIVGSLSYLGLGVQPPASDWGSMLADAQPYMQRLPVLVLAPGLAIFLTALSVTLLGQGLGLAGRRPTREAAPDATAAPVTGTVTAPDVMEKATL